METTLGELKTMLLEKYKIEDPLERKILGVELLHNSSIMTDDAKTLGAVGLFKPEVIATVIYKRNNVEAATKAEVHTRGFFHLNIPSACTSISDHAFNTLLNLVSVNITQSVTRIGKGAFAGCASLASITLGESVTHIEDYAFEGCTSLPSITLGDSVTHVRNYAFRNCTSLASVTLGKSVKHIGFYAFAGCTSLGALPWIPSR